ncbi:MAG: hypothetical protein C0594_12125 [Marinilabiliales bacterium]|nr:MAG: hypothetical protein C0594_12125 [Marinilabiliales bacterium]
MKIKEIFRRIYLIPAFNIFAVLSILVGISLLVYFATIFKGYFTKLEDGEFAITQTAQNVDFMGLTYGILWTALGIFFHLIALRLQIIELKYQIITHTQSKEQFPYEKFETDFLKLTRKQVLQVKDMQLTLNESNGKKETYKEHEVFKFINNIILNLLKALPEKSENLNQQNKFNHALQNLGITKLSFVNDIKSLPSREDQLTAIADVIYKKYHYYLNEFMDNIFATLSIIHSYIQNVDNTDQNNIEKKQINTEDYISFTLKQLSGEEKSLIYYLSFCNKKLQNLLIELNAYQHLTQKNNKIYPADAME